MGTPLGPKYLPYTYMDPLGKLFNVAAWRSANPSLVRTHGMFTV